MNPPTKAIVRPTSTDAIQFIGSWRLIAITTGGKTNQWRGAHPTGMITYHESGWMAAQIQPDRPPVQMVGTEPTADEALQALYGYTAYFGTFTVDDTTKIVTHHRAGSVSPGWDKRPVFQRAYVFEGANRVLLHPVGNTNELIWERLI